MNLRFIRKKIKTVGNVKKITYAMQMVSAVKMKKSQALAQNGSLYRATLFEMLADVASETLLRSFSLWTYKGKPTKTLKIVITSNKGLCGNFNLSILKLLHSEVDYDTTDFIVIGKKGGNFLRKMGANIIADFSSQIPFESNVSAIFELMKTKYLAGEYKKIDLYFNKFISTSVFTTTIQTLLPLNFAPKETPEDNKEASDYYLIEPSPEEILSLLLEDVLQESIRGAILDSTASEHSSRMLAMKQASDSAEEIVGDLTRLRNKFRQSAITNELLDMTAAKLSITN